MEGGRYAPPLQMVWNCSPNTSLFTISGGSPAASSSFFAMVSIMRGTIKIIFGANSLIFFAMRIRESLIQIMLPRDTPFKMSMLRQ